MAALSTAFHFCTLKDYFPWNKVNINTWYYSPPKTPKKVRAHERITPQTAHGNNRDSCGLISKYPLQFSSFPDHISSPVGLDIPAVKTLCSAPLISSCQALSCPAVFISSRFNCWPCRGQTGGARSQQGMMDGSGQCLCT